MATRQENQDIQELKTDVALLKQSSKYISNSVDDIKVTLKGFNFVSREDFEKLTKRVEAIETYNNNNRVGAFFSNLFASKALTWVIGAIIAAAIYYISKTGQS